MMMRRSSIITLTTLFASSLLISFSFAQDTLLINYQGRLTDDGGNPISGTPPMTFTVYDGAGVSKWTESHSAVQVDNGLFNVLLGSQTALPDSVFTGQDRYLGISVAGDQEITPRTLLTSAPGAAVARRVAGNVETGDSRLIIKNSSGDSTIRIDAGSAKGTPSMSFAIPAGVHPSLEFSVSSVENSIKLGFAQPPDPIAPAIELNSGETGSMVQVSWGQPPDPHREAFLLNADNSGNAFRVNSSWPSDPEQPVFEVFSDAITEGVSLRLGAPPDPMTPEIEMTANDVMTSLRLGQPPDPYAPGIELRTSVDNGPTVKIYDDVGQVMGIEPSPFDEGFSVKLLDPTDGGSLLEMNSNHMSNEATIRLMEPGDDNEMLTLSTGPSTGPSVKMFNPQPGKAATTVLEISYDSLNGGGTVRCYSDGDSSTAVLTGRDLSFLDGTSMNVYINSGGGAAFGQSVGIGVWPITNILHVQQDSPTDPIADAWTIYSSKRWKKNIEPIEGALEKVEELQGVYFDWKSNGRHDLGLIAEEVGVVVPEAVAYEDNGVDAKSVDYGRITALLVEAVKDLSERNQELETEIVELKTIVERILNQNR